MRLEYQILLAVVIDLCIGDPRRFPHPVRLIGACALRLEEPTRKLFGSPRIAGLMTAAVVIGLTAGLTALIVVLATSIHPWAGIAVSVVIMYTGLAPHDLVKHSMEVWLALADDDMREARRRVGMMCGRDTENLDKEGIARATVESVAENMVDGVTAPVFWAVIGGPVGIMTYKAVSTLDSTFGYRNERYAEFGWASARLDDIAAFVPARLTAALVPAAAFIVGLRARDARRIFIRDRRKHPSPNAGRAEAAVAGALGVQLGGLSFYEGRPSHKPTLGDPVSPIQSEHIVHGNFLMIGTSALFVLLMLLGRVAVVNLSAQAWS